MSLGGYNMSTKKKIEKELEKEHIIHISIKVF